MRPLIAQMVIRDEEDRFLERVLTRLKDQVDQIIVTDDCSTDNSAEIARSLGCHVMVLDQPLFTKDEGLLRQTAWHHLELYAPEDSWVLAIDADEMFYPSHDFDTLLAQDRYNVLGVEFFHMWSPSHYRIDKAWKPNMSSRLFRYAPNGKFAERKLACGSEPMVVQRWIHEGKALWETGLRMKHLGYERDEDKKAKYERYCTIDGGRFHADSHIQSIMDPDPVLVEWIE